MSFYYVKYISENFDISDVLDKSTDELPYSFQMQQRFIRKSKQK